MTAEPRAARSSGAARPSGASPSFDAARFLRAARAETRARAPRTDRFVDTYVLVLGVVVVGAWAYGLSSGLGGQAGTLLRASRPGGALHREAAPWLGPGFPMLGASLLLVLAWAGLVRKLVVLGPVGIAPDRAFWLWRLPLGERHEPGRALGRAALVTGTTAAGTGGCLAAVAWWAALPPAGDGQGLRLAALVVCTAALGVSAVGAAACLQASRSGADAPLRTQALSSSGAPRRWSTRSAGVLVVLLGGPVPWVPAGLALPGSGAAATAVAVTAVAAAAAAAAVVAGTSAARSLTGPDLRRAGARTRYLANSVRLMSTADLRQSLAGVDQSAVRRSSADIPGWVRGSRRVVLFAALAAEARTAWCPRAGVDLLVLALLLAAFPASVVLAAWAGLLVVACRGLGRGVGYVVAARSGNAAERHLPLSGAAAAGVRLIVPCALNALVVGTASALAGLAVQGPLWAHLAAGTVAGCGIGAAAVHRVLAPDPDLTRPPVDSPAGPIPHAQIAAYGRGLGLVLLLAAGPAVLVLLPHLWPAVLAGLAGLALVAAGLASGAGTRV